MQTRELATRQADDHLVPWSRAAMQLLQAGPRGNAMAVDTSDALRLLRQWTRAAAFVTVTASGVLLVVTYALLGLLLAEAIAIGGPVGLLVVSLVATAATAALVYRVWRIPLLLALVRYGIVSP